LLLANFLASALASERGFHAFLLTWLEVKGVALDLLDNVFLLNFALETAQGILEGFTLLQSNFRQTDTPPSSSGRTRIVITRILPEVKRGRVKKVAGMRDTALLPRVFVD
jgi:hypothetical protein